MLTLEQHRFELHGSTYTQIFLNKYILHDLYLVKFMMWNHEYRGPTVKLYLDFRLWEGWARLTPMLFRGQLCNLAKLAQIEMENLNIPITVKRDWISPAIKFHNQIASAAISIKYSMKKLPQLYTTCRDNREEGTFLNSFYETSITLIPKPEKKI